MAVEEPGQEPSLSPQDARLDALEERLERAKRDEAVRTGRAPKADANEQMGQKVLSLLIGGLVGGALLGWVLDRIFATGHLLLIAGIVLGTIGAFWSIFKIANRRS